MPGTSVPGSPPTRRMRGRRNCTVACWLKAGRRFSERMVLRFAEPDLHAELLSRIVMGNLVVDHERVTSTFLEGRGTVEMICVYEVLGDLIQHATFALGRKCVPPEGETST